MNNSTSDTPHGRRILIWIVATSFFMEMLDATILNNAIPRMAKAFDRSPIAMQMVLVAYLLTVALLIPVSGWLADRFGTRKVFCTAISIFTLGSLLCALAPNFPMLVCFRVVQGIGGAMMVPVGRLIVIKVFPRHELISALSFITIPGLIGPLVGPTLSGLILEYTTWHWLFLINIPIGIVGATLALRYLPDLKDGHRPFDLLGFTLFGLSMVLIMLGLDGAGELRFPWHVVALCLLGGSGCLASFAVSIRRTAVPLFEPRLFEIRTFSIGIAGNLVARLANGTLPFLIPLTLQIAYGYTPLAAGLTMIPLAAAAIVAKRLVEPILRICGFRRFLFWDTVLLGVMVSLWAFLTPSFPYPLLLVFLALLGMVNALQFSSITILTLYDLPEELKSEGNSLLSILIQMATSLGVAVASTLLIFFAGHVRVDPHAKTLILFQKTFLVIGLLVVAAAFLFLLVPREKRPE